jgi:hypothetical protein
VRLYPAELDILEDSLGTSAVIRCGMVRRENDPAY